MTVRRVVLYAAITAALGYIAAGSGSTLAVATGMGRTATGIDIDSRNAELARERVGMFLQVDYGTREATA